MAKLSNTVDHDKLRNATGQRSLRRHALEDAQPSRGVHGWAGMSHHTCQPSHEVRMAFKVVGPAHDLTRLRKSTTTPTGTAAERVGSKRHMRALRSSDHLKSGTAQPMGLAKCASTKVASAGRNIRGCATRRRGARRKKSSPNGHTGPR